MAIWDRLPINNPSPLVLNIADFRTYFPAFADTATYPDTAISMFWDFATDFIDDSNIGLIKSATKLRMIYLMMAHLMTMAAKSGGALGGGIGTGGTTGTASASLTQSTGIENHAQVDKVSVGMQNAPVKNMMQYNLAQTPAGQELMALIQMLVAGGRYIGGSPERLGIRKIGGSY